MQTKTKKILEWSSIFFLVLIALTASSLFAYQVAYAGKIYRNVYVADINLSGKSKNQAFYILEKTYVSMLEENLTIKTGGEEVNVKVADTGIILDTDKVIEESYSVGRNESFFAQLRESVSTLFSRQKIDLSPKINQEKYNKFIEIAVAQLNIEPQNASLIVENGEIKTIEEKSGKTVNTENLINELLNITSPKKIQDIEISANIVAPTIKTANADFTSAQNYAESILGKNISFKYEDKTYSPSRTQLGNWIVFSDNDGKYSASLSNSNIQAYLNVIANDFEISKIDKKINAVDNSVIEEGREGKYLDKENAISQIKSQIISSQNINVILNTYIESPKEVKVSMAEGVVPGRFEGKYIDVDLANQKLCKIDGQNILSCFTVSTGKPSMPTPTGTYAIQNKNPKQWSGTYGLWMPFWQAFDGNYGLHELPEWPGGKKEGENHLGTPVSHGCIRLGIGSAEDVYNFTEVGTPFYIHK